MVDQALAHYCIAWWSHRPTGRLESVAIETLAQLGDLRQAREDSGDWDYVGETPCDCGCLDD